MKITNFDKQLFKSKDNTKARDFADEANVKLNARKLIGDEDAALKVFDSTISEVYSDAAVHDAQTLTFPPANTDVFCVNRGKFLKPKRI